MEDTQPQQPQSQAMRFKKLSECEKKEQLRKFLVLVNHL